MNHEITKSIIEGASLTKEELAKALLSDLRIVQTLVNEFVNDPEIKKVVTDVYWNRYLTIRDNMAKQPELDLLPKTN